MEKTANLVMAGCDERSIDDALEHLLERSLAPRSRRLAIIVLMKIWARPSEDLVALRDAGLELLRSIPKRQRLAVHWGMTLATYPFWGEVASCVGRLIKLQGRVAHAEVRRRIVEQFGQRPTVNDAVRRTLRSMIDWGVLTEIDGAGAPSRRGVYGPAITVSIESAELVAWLVEAMLHAHPSHATDLREAKRSAVLFPFRLEDVTAYRLLNASRRIEIVNNGPIDELVVLKQKAR
jgi:hypothetical protein